MVSSRKVSLPLAEPARGAPTVDAVRARLGGRVGGVEADPWVGALVRYAPDAPAVVGAVLFVRDEVCDVWAGDGRVRRVARGLTERVEQGEPESDPSDEALAMHAVAADARAFGALREGARVRFTAGGTLGEGTLVEKCRYGGLVLRDDGSIAGVGFRALWAHPG